MATALYHIHTITGNHGVLQRLSPTPNFNVRIKAVKTWVEISERRLKSNYKLLADAAGHDTAVLAVIKANAYGHGAALCAPILARSGAEWLGVTDATEGATVRESLKAAGIPFEHQPQIMVMSGSLPQEAAAIIHHNLVPIVWEQHQLESIAAAVHQHDGRTTPYPVHLEIDTGMTRQGIAPSEQLHTLLHWLVRQPALRLEGILTHFSSSEAANSPQTAAQRKRFEEAIAAVASAGLEPNWIHVGNSSTLDNQSTGEDDNLAWLRALAATIGARPMVRPGIALYGYCLPIETDNGAETANPRIQPKVQPKLQPVMTWKTRVLAIRDVQPGDTIGYNATFIAEHPMRLALLPIGYADGLRRELSSTNSKPGGWVMIHNHRAPIVGRISMNLTVVDVTQIPVVTSGDEVTVLGDGITADDHARLAHTISYEIVCGVRVSSHLV
jgi:alanine racemase